MKSRTSPLLLSIKLHDINWEEGLCLTTERDKLDQFHRDKQDEDTRAAKRLCRQCPIIEKCFIFAYVNRLSGVYGGTSSRERAKIRKRREQEKAA